MWSNLQGRGSTIILKVMPQLLLNILLSRCCQAVVRVSSTVDQAIVWDYLKS